MTATDLIRGQQATVASFSDEKLAVFLAERGVVAGERLTVERIAPMGDPIAIRVADHLLCLRRNIIAKTNRTHLPNGLYTHKKSSFK
jgi:ferrous iron transport protein A